MQALDLIGVAGFASVWMLAWGAAASIPIVLHLLNRRRQQTVSWAAMRLLLQAIEKQSKRVRIEQLILLAIRTAILIVLAIALARPFFAADSNLASVDAQRAPRLWIFVLDNSYSMGYRDEQGTRFAAAQTRCQQLVRSAIDGDAFSIVTLSEPSEAILLRPSFDSASVQAAIQKLQLADTGADLSSTLSRINEVLIESKRSDDYPSDVHIVFLSDFGNDTWKEALNSGSGQRPLKQLANEHTLVYESFASSGTSNTAITAMSIANTRSLKDRPLAIDVTVSNFSAAEVTQVPLQLTAGGQVVATQTLDLPPAASRVVHFTIQPTAIGLTTIAATLPDDRLAADNERYAVIDVRESFPVLCVNGPNIDARILKSALQPPVTTQASIRVTSISQVELSAAELDEFDSVVLNDVSSISSSDLQRLEAFVREGNSLVCLLGPQTDSRIWNEFPESNRRLLGYRLDAPSEIADWRVDPLDYTSPITAPFAAYPDAGLLTTPIFRYWKIELSEPTGTSLSQVSVELKLQDGGPLVVVNRLGQGQVASLLSAPQTGTSVDSADAWNAMAAWPSFVPLMQQLVQSTLSDTTANHNLTVGQRIEGTINADGATSLVRIARPDGGESELQASDTDAKGQRSWSYRSTNNRGVYQANAANSAVQPYAVNIRPVESELRSVQTEQLPKSPERTASQVVSKISRTDTQLSNHIAQWLLGLLAMLLVTESCLAWHLGRRLG